MGYARFTRRGSTANKSSSPLYWGCARERMTPSLSLSSISSSDVALRHFMFFGGSYMQPLKTMPTGTRRELSGFRGHLRDSGRFAPHRQNIRRPAKLSLSRAS